MCVYVRGGLVVGVGFKVCERNREGYEIDMGMLIYSHIYTHVHIHLFFVSVARTFEMLDSNKIPFLPSAFRLSPEI